MLTALTRTEQAQLDVNPRVAVLLTGDWPAAEADDLRQLIRSSRLPGR